ncbi:MAG: aspartate 1-decarboxylase [Spirochaetia bacterium]|nr:aspartate 1-decarboxylase [Spirochaetia bacterium]
MFVEMLKSKIHRATVTGKHLEYEGSITIDSMLMEAADIVENEKVHVLNLNNGVRLETYVITGKRGSGEICINGAAARLAEKNDMVIIVSYGFVEKGQSLRHKPIVVKVDGKNRIKVK